MSFHFKTSSSPRKIRIDTRANKPPRPPVEPAPQLFPIQGIMPDSKEEFWCALWLDGKKLAYKFQYRVFGGPKYFYNIDFVIYTVPLWTMLEIYGNHWHTDTLGRDDKKRQTDIENSMRDVAKIPMRFLMADDLINRETEEAALERMFRET